MENLHNRRKIDPELSRNCFIGAAIGAVTSIMGGNQAAGDAKRNRKKGDKQYAQAGEQYDLLGGYADDWMQRYTDLYSPIEKMLAEDVQAGPDYEGVGGQAATDATLAYDKAKEGEERRLQRYGIDPSMGRSDTGSDLDRARTEVMAKNTAYDREEDKDWARKMAFTQMGRGLEAGAAGVREGIAGGRRGMGGSYMQQAAADSERAGAMYSAAGGAISSMFSGGGGIPGLDFGGSDSGSAAPTAGVDYGIPTSNVYNGFTGYGDDNQDYP